MVMAAIALLTVAVTSQTSSTTPSSSNLAAWLGNASVSGFIWAIVLLVLMLILYSWISMRRMARPKEPAATELNASVA